MTVIGTRPGAIKLFPLIHALEAHDRVESAVCVTGQHGPMVDEVLALANIRKDYDLALMHPDQTLDELAVVVLTRFGNVLDHQTSEWVTVQGDKSSAKAGAITS